MQGERQWYVGYVRSCQEKRVAAALQAIGEEYYLPIRKERRKWSDRVKTVDVILLRGMIFIHTTEKQRIPLLQHIYGLYAFMVDKCTHRAVTVPDVQMQAFMFMVDRSSRSVIVTTEHYAVGDKVKICQGSMEGLEGELIRIGNSHRLIIRLQHLGCAMVEVEVSDVEKLTR